LGTLTAQVAQLQQTGDALQRETSSLANALRSPQVRGRWGEMQLRRTAELAGMTEHCDFFEQQSVSTEDGRLRPDMIVRLPAGREIIVDSKVPFDAYQRAFEATTDVEREAALADHVRQLRDHINALATKRYWDQFPKSPDFVVLFLPNDSFLAAAATRDFTLINDALEKRVVLATPMTFIALLRSIEYGWRQETIAESAQKISQLGRDLYDRIVNFIDHVEDVGEHLEKSIRSYNSAVGSLEKMLLPQARKFKELGVEGKKDVPEPLQITLLPRSVAAAAE